MPRRNRSKFGWYRVILCCAIRACQTKSFGFLLDALHIGARLTAATNGVTPGSFRPVNSNGLSLWDIYMSNNSVAFFKYRAP